MNSVKLLKYSYASSVAAILAIVFATVITIWAELDPGLKGFLKSVTGHHWVTKSWGVVLVYIVGLILFSVLPKEIKDNTVRRAVEWAIVAAILGALAIFSFFLWHYL